MFKKLLLTFSAILMLSGCTIRFEVIEPDPYYQRPICTHARMIADIDSAQIKITICDNIQQWLDDCTSCELDLIRN